jgi:hypothetical protein
LLESIQGQSQPHNGRGILSILPPLKMSGQKIDSHVESLRPIFWGFLFGGGAQKNAPQKPHF